MLRLLSKALTFAHYTKLNLRGHMTFKDLGVDPALTKVLHASRIDKPFQIQKPHCLMQLLVRIFWVEAKLVREKHLPLAWL